MKFGEYGESLAAKYLQGKGFRILKKNYRKAFGEIDLVALHENTVVFVEVKSRRTQEFGLPREAITNAKLRSIVKVARYFLVREGFYNFDSRIDLIEILVIGGKPYVCHTENIGFI